MSEDSLDIKATKPQREFLGSTAPNTVFQAGARSGKTWAGALKACLLLMNYPEVFGMVVAPTYKMLEQASLPHIMSLAGQLGIRDTWLYNKQSRTITMPNGAVMFLRSAEDSGSVLGATLGWAVIDEVGLWRQKQAYDYLQDRLSDPRGPRQLFATYTPKGTAHWAYTTLGQPKQNLKIIKATTQSNPTLPEDYLERLRIEHGNDAKYWKQEIEGEFVTYSGLIYSDFDLATHVKEPPPLNQFVKVVAGVDFGWTDPGVIVVLGMDINGVYWLIDEVYERQKSLEWWLEQAKNLQARYWISQFLCDPSQPANINAYVSVGLPAEKAHNAIIPGITAIASRFGNNGLFINEKCINTIAELGMYCWKMKADGSSSADEPAAGNDHALDSLRYGLFGLLSPQKQIAKFKFMDIIQI